MSAKTYPIYVCGADGGRQLDVVRRGAMWCDVVDMIAFATVLRDNTGLLTIETCIWYGVADLIIGVCVCVCMCPCCSLSMCVCMCPG